MATGETGFDDVTLDLISAQYHSLKAGHDYGQYARDAKNAAPRSGRIAGNSPGRVFGRARYRESFRRERSVCLLSGAPRPDPP